MNPCQSPLKVFSKNEEKCKIVIYGLHDPETGELRYVGKTSVALDARLRRHLCDRHTTHKVNWIKSLLRKGLKPVIRAIEETTDGNWQVTEQRIIRECREKGYRLTNLDSGGRGGHIVEAEVREKMRLSQLRINKARREHYGGLAKSPATREKLRKNALGHSWNRGWTHSDKTKLLLSKLSLRHAPQTRLRMLGNTTITPAGRARLSEHRRRSAVLFNVSDDEWKTLTSKEVATKYGTSYSTANNYRWRHGKPKRVKPAETNRRCRLCGTTKPIGEFHRSGKHRRWECKSCAPAYKAPYRK